MLTNIPYGVDSGLPKKGIEIMANKKQTSPSVASKAGKLLSSSSSSKAVKSVAASDLAQTRAKRKKSK